MGITGDVSAKIINKLSRKIQKCLIVPCKIPEVNDPKDVAQLAMLLAPLPVSCGPLSPRQAINLGQVDYYGRTILMTSLLQGLGQHSYVLLGKYMCGL